MGAWLRNIGLAIAVTAVNGNLIHDSLDGFGQNAGNTLEVWGKDMGRNFDSNHPIHIAMTKTGEFSFAAAEGTLGALDWFGTSIQTAIGLYELYQQVPQIDWDRLSREARNVFSVQRATDLPKEIAQWIVDHPGQTAFLTVGGVVFFAPHLVTVPVLASLGFTADGVAAGSAAAALHSMIGTVSVGSIFTLLQSAGAGGAGLAVVNVLVSTGAGAAVGTNLYFSR
ncbi:hypothetical protein C8A03DRAFT_30913 [Achaetomium macrosporum]|uniref:Uncharacterized protein n=1 Tax=Achaetomium macrosporum TaxID=79813 RepID=A0AAN7CF70_9PEZI|nr:hypothetical protein C8A03DRAFT_30913 [Achaetomium macrosporum]